jgi:hypothetical protein
MTSRSAVVVGGGLAGMVIARELAIRHWRVILLERSQRLGGKAGSDLKNGRLVEHGYHVFPQWYRNVRTILDRIGVRLIDFDRYHYLLPGQYPRRITVFAPASVSELWHNIFHGLLPWYHNILSSYFVLDMISRPISEKKLLDHVSQVGLMRGKWYISESVAELSQENILKASAIPAYDLSAMTAKRIGGYWIRGTSPFLSVLPGDLQTVFIDPQARELEALGVDIRYGAEVSGVLMRDGEQPRLSSPPRAEAAGLTAGVNGDIPFTGEVSGIELRDGTQLSADVYALCTPFEVTRTWLNDRVYEADPELGNMHFLEAQPMAALHLRLRRDLSELPREHVFFQGSRYALSLIENSRLWNGSGSKAELSFISSNYGPLMKVSEEGAKDLLLEEIGEYLPITRSDVESWELNSNVDVPLFINTIGAWPNRPRAKSKIRNLYLAGDYVKNEIDLACMEGAVSAALEASRQILVDQKETGSLPAAQVPPVWPHWLLVAARILLIPVVAVVRIIAWLEEKLAPRRPDVSETRRKADLNLARDPRPPRKRELARPKA